MKTLGTFILFICLSFANQAQSKLDTLLPVRGFCIAAPQKEGLERFTNFIKEELGPMGVNTLILRIDYNFEFEKRPELRGENPLSKEDVKKLVNTCKEAGIRLIPQFNLLGHQSWASKLNNLLKVYPQFDETPHIEIPEDYEWPNEDGLYCKSYCPLHPEVHAVVFDIIDELLDVFEADAFHAGMDEVFYIGDDRCPRCGGKDKAELFAADVTKIRNYLAQKNAELWIWGDRLLDGKTTGLGMWEASMNNTHRAIDLIPKDVVINDWHYERADPTPVLFAAKGYNVMICPWRKGDVATAQLNQIINLRKYSSPEMSERFRGIIQTVWNSPDGFMNNYYAEKLEEGNYASECFKELYGEIATLK